MNQKFKIVLTIFCSFSFAFQATANTLSAPHVPIGHCYHWLQEKTSKFLSYKYKYARNNNGEVTFYTTPATSSGAVAGPGLYCAKTPTSSISYGDRVIRIDFVDDVVMFDSLSGRQYCGKDGQFYASQSECNSKAWDIKFYNGGGVGNTAWYVIRNPQAIASWSANSQQVEQDLIQNKAGSSSQYQMHADQAIQAMSAERTRLGELTIVNGNARMDLLDVLKDPNEIAKIPPLGLIARVVKYPSSGLPDSDKVTIYNEQMIRAFKDIYLAFDDFESVVSMDPALKDIFSHQAARVLSFKNLQKYNVLAALLAADKYSPRTLTVAAINKAWSAVFQSDNVFASLNAYKFTNASVIAGFFNSLPSMTEFKKIKILNQFELLKMFNTYATTLATAAKVKPYVREIVDNYIVNASKYMKYLYADNFDNDLLEIKGLSKLLLLSKVAAGDRSLNPIYIGHAVDMIKKEFSSAEFNTVTSFLGSTPLPLDDEMTYQIFGAFMDGDFKLPSFMSKKDFFRLVTQRAINERSLDLKNSTNTFRLILSTYYEYFFKQYKVADGRSAKIAALKEAVDIYTDLLHSLGADLPYSYGYAIVQNIAMFSSTSEDLRYDVHPLETLYDKYKDAGDSNFDTELEGLMKTSLDGSFLHYLIYRGISRKESKAKNLLSLTLDSLTSTEYADYRKTKEFSVADEEKSKWRNFIYNRHIQNAGMNRTRSDFCGIALVLDKFDSELKSYVSSSQYAQLDALVDEAESAGCHLD